MKIKVRTIKLSGLNSRLVKPAREVLALLHILGLRTDRYAHLRFNRTRFFALRQAIKNIRLSNVFGQLAGFGLKVSAAVLVGVIISLPFMQAFEAHILNVTATTVRIDPPILAIPGDVGWDNPNGGANLVGDQDITMPNPDPDATHIFYSFGPGTDPNNIPNPACGTGNGGPKEPLQHLLISGDTTVKAIACDGPETSAHHSLVNTKIYTFAVPCQERFIPLDVAIVFDRSGSMNLDGELAGAKAAANNFIDILNPVRDQASLVSFATTASLDKQLTNNFADIKTTINALVPDGSTNIGDAIDKANIELDSARARGNSTKVEILLTDGKANRPGTLDDNPTAIAFAKAKADEAAAAGFILYTIGLGDNVNAAFLTDLANSTGGAYFGSPDTTELNNIYNQITHLLCGQGKISGVKFNDLNQNGQKDAGESPVAGWRITLKRGTGTFGTVLTDTSGGYEFTDLPGNVEFSIEEESRTGWQAINPASGKLSVTLNSDSQNLTGQDFANFNIGQQCESSQIIFPPNVAVLAAGNNSGSADNITVSANVTVNGSLQSNRDINASGIGSSRTVNGDILAGNQVNNAANFIVSGGHFILEHQPAAALPSIDLAEWKTKAAGGGTVNGSLIFPINTSGIELGPSEILGNLTLGANNHVTIKGPLYIHGNLTLGAGSLITEDSSFGNNLAIIIVDGTINLGANSSFLGSGISGDFLLVSTANATQSGSIQSASGTSLDRVVLFATEGNIHINTNTTVLALFAGKGYSESQPSINLEGNILVKGGVLPGQIACGPDISPDKKLSHVVINEFMPNPVGSDSAIKPGGEWVELYNNSSSTVDVGAWVLTNSISQHVSSGQSKTWTAAVDFAGGNFNNTSIESLGNERIRLNSGTTSGSYEQTFDAGAGKKGHWQSLNWNESLSANADICLQAATSDDGITYGPYSSSDCNSPFGLSSLPQTRFLKWKSSHTRTNGLDTNNADLLDVTLNYELISFNELVINNSNTDTGATILLPGDFLVVYRNGNPDFDLGNSFGSVNLYNGEPLFDALKIDSHIYNYSSGAPEGKSFTRMPDGTANWVDPTGSPGQANNEFLNPDTTTGTQVIYSSEAPAPVPELLPPQPGEDDYLAPVVLNEIVHEATIPTPGTTTEPQTNSSTLENTQTTIITDPPAVENVTEPGSEKPESAEPGAPKSQDSDTGNNLSPTPPAKEPQAPPSPEPTPEAPVAN